jgi:antitoxin CptB
MTDMVDIETWRKRLYFRAQRRGFREVDLLFTAFADKHLAALTLAQLDRFEALLGVPDWQLYGWVVGHESVPAEYDDEVFALLRDYRANLTH